MLEARYICTIVVSNGMSSRRDTSKTKSSLKEVDGTPDRVCYVSFRAEDTSGGCSEPTFSILVFLDRLRNLSYPIRP